MGGAEEEEREEGMEGEVAVVRIIEGGIWGRTGEEA